jgi:transcriptional regulator NrdR family protein
MKCNRCPAWTEVMETRQVDGGHTLRRTRRCANNHRFQTFEVVAPVYNSQKRRVAAALKTIATRVALWVRYAGLAKLAREHGVNQAARQAGVDRATVQRAVRAVSPPARQTADTRDPEAG